MKAIHNTAILCGCFSIKEKLPAPTPLGSQWKKVTKTKDEKALMKKFYYPEFVNFCYPGDKTGKNEGMERYVLPLNREIEIELSEEKHHVLSVGKIELFILPYNLLIYAIHVTQDGAEINDIITSLSILRNISFYKDELNDSWGQILKPIAEVYKSVSNTYSASAGVGFHHSQLMENGNKLKLFQVVEADCAGLKKSEQDELLFELGTLAPVGSYDTNSFSSPSEEYYNKIMMQNKISVFNNWKALSLFDTFTILSYPTQSYLLDNWVNYYFGMIYIHSLFLKFYLFRMNILFRKKAAKITCLEKEFLTFERNCCFHKISYNFLPLEIYQSLDTGLEISEERRQLYNIIKQEKMVQEKEGDRTMNNLLFFLTCLTIFSTVWDFTCLFNQLFPYEEAIGSTIRGYRVVTSVVLFFVVLLILINRFVGKGK